MIIDVPLPIDRSVCSLSMFYLHDVCFSAYMFDVFCIFFVIIAVVIRNVCCIYCLLIFILFGKSLLGRSWKFILSSHANMRNKDVLLAFLILTKFYLHKKKNGLNHLRLPF